ncbi:MAG TPA: LAGLIDADG family homing endonuclease, partial [Tepidisphaeraceae bacterium]|nr:LAGLIDADG family homing endonuclease [Tepidisphaeraceae bacterium]
MKITRRFTKPGADPFSSVTYEKRTSRIANPDGSVVFEMNDAEIPAGWSQLATDIMVSKYFRKAGVPQKDEAGQPMRDGRGQIVTGPERSAKEVINRLAGCWRYWGDKFGYFDSADDSQAFYDEMVYMLLHQMCAPNSPQWFNTGLNFAYGITGPAQGHWYCDPKTGELSKSRDAYSHPQPHACQPFHAPVSTPRGPVPIGKVVMQKMIGLEVLDGTDGGNGTTHIVAVKSNGFKEVFRVVLEDGSAVEATADHLIYAMASDGLSGRWVRLDSLERGALLVKSVRDRQPAPPPSSPASAIAAAHDAEFDSVAAPPSADTAEVRTLRQVAVKRIDRVSAQEVFDIQTESGQYLSNYILIHNCFIQSVSDDLVNSGGIMDLWTREARLFKYGSGTGSNFSKIRGENEPLSGGGKSSGLMSFLKIGDRAAGAIKSGGTTRRAAKMVCLDLDHPDVEQFINWKVREELKVAALAEGMKHLSKDQRETAKRLGLKLDYDFNGEAYLTVSGQNSNNSVRIPNRFFKAVQENGEWVLTSRTTGKVTKSARAAELWDQIAYAAWRCADPGVQYDDTINQWHTCPRSGRINASNPCVTGDTRVLTPDGVWRRIDQMIHIPGGVVTAKDGQEVHFTDGAFPTGTREVYELRTVGGYRLTLTADHRVWTRNRGWVAAENLRESDQIKLPSEPACPGDIGEPNDEKFFQLLGLYVSGANGNLGAVNLEQCLADGRFREAMTRYVIGGERVYADDYVDPAMLSTESPGSSESGGTMTASFTNRRLISRLRAYVRNDSGRAGLSDEAFTAGLAAQKHLLRALFSADGSIDGGTLSLHSASQALLEDVQLILLGFGIQSALSSGDCDALDTTQDGGGASVCGELPDRRRGALHSGARSPNRGDAAIRRHGLRIDSGSLRSFIHHIGFLPGTPLASAAG